MFWSMCSEAVQVPHYQVAEVTEISIDTINYDAQVTIVCELSNKPVIDEMPEFTFHTDRFV